jgi:hypothetical protein
MKASFTLHGLGFTLPYGMPLSLAHLIKIKELFQQSHNQLRSMWDALPSSSSRLDVDWIFTRPPLYDQVNDQEEFVYTIHPRLMGVAETRNSNFSSDHIPIIAVLEIKRSKRIMIEKEIYNKEKDE